MIQQTTSGMMAMASMASDERAKQDIRSLEDGAGAQHEQMKALLAQGPAVGGEPRAERSLASTAAAHHLSPEQLDKLANDMAASVNAQHAAMLAQGPAVGAAPSQEPPAWLDSYMASDARAKTNAKPAERNAASSTRLRGGYDELSVPRDESKERMTQLDAAHSNHESTTFSRAYDWVGDQIGKITPETTSDERAKQGTHREGDMGHALAQGFEPFEYEYKPDFAGAEHQEVGEKNVGPMAQNMAKNPVTGSAVKQDPSGLLVLDIPKVTKVNSAGIGYLAARQQRMEQELARMKGGR
jgi:hypothetical protein